MKLSINIGLAISLLTLLLGSPSRALGQAFPFSNPEVQYLDNNGQPLAGSKVCTYLANTSTPQATFVDSTGSTANTNPVILDAGGRASIWLGSVLYKIVLLTGGDGTCSTGTVVWTQNNVGASFSTGGSANYVQYSLGNGLFGGSADFAYNPALQTVTIVGQGAASAALTIVNGYVISQGFDASVNGAPTTPLPYNIIQAPYGGVYALSGTFLNYVQPGSFASLSTGPTLTTNDSWEDGALSWHSGSDGAGPCVAYYPGALPWVCLGSGGGGGGGNPSGITGSIQTYATATTFGGDANLTYLGGNVVLGGSGYFEAAGGFNSTSTAANSVQTLGGALLGTLLTWQETAAPGAANAGQDTVYADSTAHQLYWASNGGSTYIPIAVLSGALTNGHCPQITVSAGQTTLTDSSAVCGGGGGSGTVVASPQYQLPYYSSAGTTAAVTGTSGLTFNPAIGTLTISGGSGTGIVMTNFSLTAAGVMQLTATSSNVDLTAATAYNAFQAPDGGIGDILSGTFVQYIQPGSFASLTAGPTITSGDTMHVGALAYHTGSDGAGPCPAYFTGSGTIWACLGVGGGSGTVSAATANEVAFYTGTTTVGGGSGLTWNPGTTTLTVTGTGIATTGAISATGVISSTGASGGLNITAQTAANSAQSTGGFNACSGNTCAGAAFEVFGTAVISSARYGTFTGITDSGVTGSTQCAQFNSAGVLSGTGSACGGGGGGVTSITGTTNQVLASASTGAVTLSLPQSIATSSQPTFTGVISTAAFNANVSASTIGFQTSNTNFQVDGYGDVSGQGSANFSGSTSGLAPYRVGGTAIINSSAQWIGGAVLSTGNVAAGASSTFAVGSSYFGQARTGGISLSLSGGGTCTLYFNGGILYALSGC